MSKPWQPYAQHTLDCIAKINHIQKSGDLTRDEVLYDAVLRNLQTLSEATHAWPPFSVVSANHRNSHRIPTPTTDVKYMLKYPYEEGDL